MTDSNREIITGEEMLVEGLHQQFGGTDSDRIAHCQHKLHASLYQMAAQAGLALANLFARLTSIQDSYWDVMLNQQAGQF